MNILETEGLGVPYPGETEPVKGTLLCMTGDNLGGDQIGGFNENFSTSHYCCRFCEQTQLELRTDPFSSKPKRTIQSYEDCVKEAIRTRKAVKGIKRSSPLNSIPNYHVCNPGLPPCTAHDLFEGIVPYDFHLGICYLIKKNWFSEALLNYRLNDLNLFPAKQICIPEIKEQSKKLYGTASQIRRLVMIFPVLVADKIKNAKDEVWIMILHLRQICDIVCAPAVSQEQIAILQDEIHTYVQLRMKCFPKVPLRPKHGFILHYPDLIYEFGPLKHVWTLRFESEHGYMKRVIRHHPNFKNVTQLLADKHELMQSAKHNQYVDLAVPENFTEYNSQLYSNAVNTAINALEISNIKYVCTKVNFRGVEYVTDNCLVVGKSIYGHFVMCKISLIFVNDNHTNIYFLGTTSEIIYNSDVGVYEVEEDENFASNESSAFSLTPPYYLPILL